MSQPSHTGYILPGWADEEIHFKAHVSFAASYSRRCNPRNLEHPWYGPWQETLRALIHDIPSLSVSSQEYLWYDRSAASARGHIPPIAAPKTHEQQDYAEYDADEVGNTTLDSIGSFTLSPHRNKFQLVDVVITRTHSGLRVHNRRPEDWCFAQKVIYRGIPVLCELKRSGPRVSNFLDSLDNADKGLREAEEQLICQAHHLFKRYGDQQRVLLIAVCGIWWVYRVLFKNEAREPTEIQKVAFDESEESNMFDYDPEEADCGEEPTEEVVKDKCDKLYEGLEGIKFTETVPGNHKLHPILSVVGKIDPEPKKGLSRWSNALAFGTAPSNQVLFMIHEYLKDISINQGDYTRG